MWQKWLNKKPLILETGEQFAHWFFFLRTPTERSNKTKKATRPQHHWTEREIKDKKTQHIFRTAPGILWWCHLRSRGSWNKVHTCWVVVISTLVLAVSSFTGSFFGLGFSIGAAWAPPLTCSFSFKFSCLSRTHRTKIKTGKWRKKQQDSLFDSQRTSLRWKDPSVPTQQEILWPLEIFSQFTNTDSFQIHSGL